MKTSDVNLYLVGFMGTGKTTVGRAIAYRNEGQFLDVDAEIEHAQGRAIPQIFADDGEPVFRALERAFIETGHPARGQIIACGGGLVVQPGMLERLKSQGVVICLHASLETILQRTSQSKSRPLLNVENPLDRIRALYAAREPIYRNAGTLVLTDGRSLNDIIGHVTRIYRREAAEFSRAHPSFK